MIGNNIANVNTVGFKYGRATFQDMLSQTLRGASSPKGKRGGIDPMQVGMGVSLRSVDIVFTPGNLESTGKLTDMAIQGNGFFVVRDASDALLFTRDGAFKIDAFGQLTHPATGYQVQGWMADASGKVDSKGEPEAISIPLGTSMNATATSEVGFVGNLDAGAATAASSDAAIPVYDSLGEQHTVRVSFTKTANPREWTWNATFDGGAGSVGSGTITFKNDGKFDSVTPTPSTVSVASLPNGAKALSIDMDFSALSQYGQASSVSWSHQNGFPAGSLETFNIDDRGIITGVYSNGQYDVIAQMALASFANSEGLMRAAGNMFVQTTNSGTAQVGEAAMGGRGSILGTTLEMSNVDLAREFTDMIVTQRGFQANSRVITSADEMLQELLSLKR